VEEQRRILYDKMACDAMISVQAGLLLALPFFFAVLILIPSVQALMAGQLWRRYQRPWPVIILYAQRIIPLTLTLLYSAARAWDVLLLSGRVPTNWIEKFQHYAWRLEILLAVLVVAQVAAWRSWFWPLRLFLHAAWITLSYV